MSLQSIFLQTKPSMALIYTSPTRFDEGEEKTGSLLHVPDGDNSTSPGLSPHARRLLIFPHYQSLFRWMPKDVLRLSNVAGRRTRLCKVFGSAHHWSEDFIGSRILSWCSHSCWGTEIKGKSTNNNEDGRLVSALRVHLAMRDRVKSLEK